MGYAFCQLKEQPFSTNMVPFKSLFIDDLCVLIRRGLSFCLQIQMNRNAS